MLLLQFLWGKVAQECAVAQGDCAVGEGEWGDDTSGLEAEGLLYVLGTTFVVVLPLWFWFYCAQPASTVVLPDKGCSFCFCKGCSLEPIVLKLVRG